MFLDRNFTTGLFIMFAVGAILLSSSATLAPYLQNLGGYSVSETGLLMAPRGVGTMIAMMLAGKLANRFDPRMLVGLGTFLLSYSLWEMTRWNPNIDAWSIAWNGIIQGAGLGFVFIPLNLMTFSTLPAHYRNEATGIFSLVRNIGSAIGISVSSVLLTQGGQYFHSQIAESVTPFNRMLQTGGAYLLWNSAAAPGLAALNAEVTRQAMIISYANDFKFMLIIGLPSAALVWLMRRPPRAAKAAQESAVID
jgi:DHA2 family multidrug resistance protein